MSTSVSLPFAESKLLPEPELPPARPGFLVSSPNCWVCAALCSCCHIHGQAKPSSTWALYHHLNIANQHVSCQTEQCRSGTAVLQAVRLWVCNQLRCQHYCRVRTSGGRASSGAGRLLLVAGRGCPGSGRPDWRCEVLHHPVLAHDAPRLALALAWSTRKRTRQLLPQRCALPTAGACGQTINLEPGRLSCCGAADNGNVHASTYRVCARLRAPWASSEKVLPEPPEPPPLEAPSLRPDFLDTVLWLSKVLPVSSLAICAVRKLPARSPPCNYRRRPV